jgi:hypothetical protein
MNIGSLWINLVLRTFIKNTCRHQDKSTRQTKGYHQLWKGIKWDGKLKQILFLFYFFFLEWKNKLVGYLNKGYPQLMTKKDKPLRKPRQRLHPRRRNKPKPRTERLNHVPSRTRLARRDASTTEKSPTRTTLGRAGRPTSLTNSETKVNAFNATANHFQTPWLQR